MQSHESVHNAKMHRTEQAFAAKDNLGGARMRSEYTSEHGNNILAERTGETSIGGSTQLALAFAALPLAAHILGASVARLTVEVAIAVLLVLWTRYMLHAPWRMYMTRRGAGNAAERFYIVLLFATPFLAAYMLHIAQALSGASSVVLGHISVPLFLCAALLRPMALFLSAEPVEGDGPAGFLCDFGARSPTLARMARRLHNAEQRIGHLEEVIASLEHRIANQPLNQPRQSLIIRAFGTLSMPFRVAHRLFF